MDIILCLSVYVFSSVLIACVCVYSFVLGFKYGQGVKEKVKEEPEIPSGYVNYKAYVPNKEDDDE